MLTASVLAKKTEVPVYTVRHYTNIGLLHPAKREDNGYKIYKQSDITLLRFITNSIELGFTLKDRICGDDFQFGFGYSECTATAKFEVVNAKRKTQFYSRPAFSLGD